MIKEIVVDITEIPNLQGYQIIKCSTINQNKFMVLLVDLGHSIEEFQNQVIQEEIPVCITNNEKIIQFVNPAWELETGFTSQEAVGHKPSILQGEKTSSFIKTEISETVNLRCSWRGFITNYKKDGTEFTKLLNIFPFNDEYWVGIFLTIDNDILQNIQNLNALEKKITNFYLENI